MSEPNQTPGGLRVSSTFESAGGTIALEGELDLATAPQLEAALEAARGRDCARLVVDLGALEFIDSTGLRLLLQADEQWRASDRELLLRPGSPTVQRVFEMTGASDALRFEDAPAG